MLILSHICKLVDLEHSRGLRGQCKLFIFIFFMQPISICSQLPPLLCGVCGHLQIVNINMGSLNILYAGSLFTLSKHTCNPGFLPCTIRIRYSLLTNNLCAFAKPPLIHLHASTLNPIKYLKFVTLTASKLIMQPNQLLLKKNK